MLRHYRRYWVFPAALLLSLPLVVGIIAPAGKAVSVNEARALAPAPSFPVSFADWRGLPGHVDAFLRDHFGLRDMFIHAYALIMSNSLFQSGNALVLTGSDGRMFLRGDAEVQQSAGLLRRDQALAKAADLLATMRSRLAAGGTRLLVAMPPNGSTIYGEQLPSWARNHGQRTEYDVFLDDLAARGIQAVDLRPVLRAARLKEKMYFKHDTHWTPRGALMAFNAIARADAHPDWELDPELALGARAPVIGGDLARLLGMPADVTEFDQPLNLPQGTRETHGDGPIATYLQTLGQPGPTIMVIGDSFTEGLFAPMLLRHVGKVAWLHHLYCGFDWGWIDRFHPDEVWWMPTERYMVCRDGLYPIGLDPGANAMRPQAKASKSSR